MCWHVPYVEPATLVPTGGNLASAMTLLRSAGLLDVVDFLECGSSGPSSANAALEYIAGNSPTGTLVDGGKFGVN